MKPGIAATPETVSRRKVIFAGGGTGGHLAPGVALAEALVSMDPHVEPLFLTCGREIESRFLDSTEFPSVSLGLRRPRWGALGASVSVTTSFLRSLREVSGRNRPALVIGLGGGVSLGPVLASFVRRRIPVVLLEQNAVAGRATRLLARFSDRVYASLPLVSPLSARVDVRVLGNPLRPCTERKERLASLAQLGLDSNRRTLTVLGGSQGARSINQAMMDAAPRLSSLNSSLQVIHVTGVRDQEKCRESYAASGVLAKVHDFAPSMGAVYGASDLVLSRAGGTTVSELEAAAVPSVLVPYPWHRDQHQHHNARVLERRGCARIISERELTGTIVLSKVVRLLLNPDAMQSMVERAESFRPERTAAGALADELSQLMMEEGKRENVSSSLGRRQESRLC